MFQNKKTIEYAKQMKKARKEGEEEKALVYFEKLTRKVKKLRKKSLIDERKNDYFICY
jgi:hypothetical protein